MKSDQYQHRSYQTINIIFTILILAVFAYAFVYSPGSGNYPIPSYYNRYMTGMSPTTGLSHSFSAIVRGHLKEARNWNPYGIRIFLFLLLQLIFRLVAFFSLRRNLIPVKKLLTADITFSILLFICCYGKLLLFWNYL